jgi:hypothetical protein
MFEPEPEPEPEPRRCPSDEACRLPHLPYCAGEADPAACRACPRELARKSLFGSSIHYGWPAPRSSPLRRPIAAGRWPDHSDRAPFPPGDGRVAVIIPTRDRPDRIGRAVASVLAQTRPATAVLVVANGPAAADSRYADALGPLVAAGRVVVLGRPELAGIAAPINVALGLVTTEFCAVLDDDDAWEPTFLARLVGALEADRTLGLACCGASHPTQDGPARAHAEPPPMDGRSCVAALALHNWFGWSQAVWRPELLRPEGLADEARGCADRDAWLRIAAVAGVWCTPATLASHAWHGGNASLDSAWMAPGIAWVNQQVAAGRYRCAARPRVPLGTSHYPDCLAGPRIA